MTTAPATAARHTTTWMRGYRDSLLYTRSLHLLTDLLLGTVYFTALVVLLSLAAGLMITLLGIPLLMLALLTARGIGHLERGRARVLLGVDTPAPSGHRTGLWHRLLDAADWRATLYGLLLLPVGVVTGSITLAGWTTMLAGLTYPLTSPWLPHPAVGVGDVQVTGVPGDLFALAVGIGLLVVMPGLVRVLARIDGALVRAVLR